jgi:hypothetical protein
MPSSASGKDRMEASARSRYSPLTSRGLARIRSSGFGFLSCREAASFNRAYTHLWKATTLAIDVKTRAIAARWPNRCADSRGIALDAQRGLLFAGCAEGKAVVLDSLHGGAVRDTLSAGAGVDIIDYNPRLGHLYLPGAKSETMAIVGASRAGKLSLLSTVKTAPAAHCVVADDRHQAWVCDPNHGRLLLVRDTLPAIE